MKQVINRSLHELDVFKNNHNKRMVRIRSTLEEDGVDTSGIEFET